jgi:hypothetical protein
MAKPEQPKGNDANILTLCITALAHAMVEEMEDRGLFTSVETMEQIAAEGAQEKYEALETQYKTALATIQDQERQITIVKSLLADERAKNAPADPPAPTLEIVKRKRGRPRTRPLPPASPAPQPSRPPLAGHCIGCAHWHKFMGVGDYGRCANPESLFFDKSRSGSDMCTKRRQWKPRTGRPERDSKTPEQE